MGLIKSFSVIPVGEGFRLPAVTVSEQTGGIATPSGTRVERPSGSGLMSVRQEFGDGGSWPLF